MNKTALPKIQLLLALSLAMSMNTAIAEDTEVTHTFKSGEPALASEVNTNFTDLAAAIDAKALLVGPAGPQGEQGAAGTNGAAGARGYTGPRGPAGAASTVPGPQGPAAHIALVPPTVNDDVNSPFTVGSIWFDNTQKVAYILLDDTANKAVWSSLSPPSHVHYEIGDTGPAGGIVFHVSEGALHGLEAAPEDIGGNSTPTLAEWGCYDTNITGADGTLIGTGAQNTADIVSANCTPLTEGNPIAANLAAAYSLNGVGGWFLPSKDELHAMYINIGEVIGFAVGNYWSSSERSNVDAWLQEIGFCFCIASNFKSSIYASRVRAVRAF